MDIINKLVEYFQPKDVVQPNFFDQYKTQLDQFEKEISYIQTEGLENQIEVVKNELKELHDYVKQAKVLVVFMGITSSGKSTFINSLLGQQLLPARNQTCTANVIYIKNDKEYKINNDTMAGLNQAYEKLQKIQNSAKINRVNISCPSYFHSRLPQDLRDRLIFVDTQLYVVLNRPGFNLSLNNPMSYFEHLTQIEDQIELEKYSYRVNIWISNYTTFDVDKEFQKKILPQFLQQQFEQLSNNQAINFLLDLEGDVSNNNLQQQSQQFEFEKQENTFIYVMNKFDERKPSEDIPLDQICQGVKEIARQDTETYKISGLFALRYNILNYGTDEAKEKFYNTFFQDYKITYGFDSLKSAKRFCLELKDNQQLIIYQDYGKFFAQLDIQTKTLISKGFKENKIHNHIEEIKVLQSLIQCKVNYNLPPEESQKLKDFFDNTRTYLINYEQQLRQYHKSYQDQMHYIIDQAKTHLSQYNSNIKQIIESICVRFIRDFEHFNCYVNNETVKRMDSIMAIIQNIFYIESPQEIEIIHPSIIIVKGCKAIIDYELDNSIPKLQEQAFQDYADRLQEKLSYNYRKYQQRSAVLTSGISAASLVAGRVILSQLAMIAPVALVGYGIAQIYFSQIDVDQDLAKQVLDQWAEGSLTQVSDMINNYIQIYHNAIDGVERLLKMFDQ